MRVLICVFILVFPQFAPAPVIAGDTIGIVLMHGKSGTAKSNSPIGKLSAILRQAGFLVATPDMPWSRSRYLAKDYEASMTEIDKAVSALRWQGASRIVVGGHSMGANAALGYGARTDGIAGIMALAPGHLPSDARFQRAVNEDYRRAAEMVQGGRGSAWGKFSDTNQGKRTKVNVRAEIYLSWFDANGPASMPVNASHLKPGTALLWAVGKEDRMFAAGRTFAYSLAPPNPKSLYLEVAGGHKATPTIAARAIIDWLRGL